MNKVELLEVQSGITSLPKETKILETKNRGERNILLNLADVAGVKLPTTHCVWDVLKRFGNPIPQLVKNHQEGLKKINLTNHNG